MKTIKIYNHNQYTGKGRLKKNTKPELLKEFCSDNITNKQIATDLKARGYHSFVSPYIFTHIDCQNAKGEQCYIYESITIGSDQKEVTTSPIKLLEALNTK